MIRVKVFKTSEVRTFLDDIVNCFVLHVGHVPQHWKGDKSRQKAGAAVRTGKNDAVPKNDLKKKIKFGSFV